MSDQEKTVLDGSEVKILTRSEQRKKNRLESRGRKKENPQEGGPESFFTRAYMFFVEAREELGRVIWPTRRETFDSTWRLLVLVSICGIFLTLVDAILTRLLSLII